MEKRTTEHQMGNICLGLVISRFVTLDLLDRISYLGTALSTEAGGK
jgi:hypothetical protein